MWRAGEENCREEGSVRAGGEVEWREEGAGGKYEGLEEKMCSDGRRQRRTMDEIISDKCRELRILRRLDGGIGNLRWRD